MTTAQIIETNEVQSPADSIDVAVERQLAELSDLEMALVGGGMGAAALQ